MSEMDGFEFLAQLRNEPRWRNIPVLIITDRALADEELTALHRNSVKVLNKTTFKQDDFLIEVNKTVTESLSEVAQEQRVSNGDVLVD
jgi:CheY-like chemotaxis protein